MTPEIIFEDDQLLIVNKPSGWVVNEAATTKGQSVLQTWLAKNYDYETKHGREYRTGIVHRLDKETSGVLIVAKTKSAFRELQRQFKEREIEKAYTALVHGKVTPEEGNINAPVGRLPWKRDRFGVLPGGREAQTSYEVISNYQSSTSKELFSLVKCFPKTGRTHQIRIHMKHLGYALVSDEFYAGRKRARGDRKWCPRLFLHASEIEFKHPQKKTVVKYESKLREDLASALASLLPA